MSNSIKVPILLFICIFAVLSRIYKIESVPPGLHWDEMDTGYQAYSLFKTGKDYFGNTLPLFPHSFADFRTPVFIYSAVPSIAAFGMNNFSVRLPNIIWSTISIFSIFVLSSLIFPKSKLIIGLITSALLAITPWHIQYSRQSVETMSSMSLVLLGFSCFIYSLYYKKNYLIISAIILALSQAAYSPIKMFTPLMLLSTLIIYRTKILKIPPKIIISSFAVYSILSAPIYLDSIFGNSGLRFKELSVFTDPTLKKEIEVRREEFAIQKGRIKEVGMQPDIEDKFMYNKVFFWSSLIVNNYLSTLSPEYLFLNGDKEIRHSPSKEYIGMLYPLEAMTIMLGLFIARKKRNNKPLLFILSWTLLSPLSGSFTRWDNPHAARTLVLLPILMIAAGNAVNFLLNKHKLIFFAYFSLTLISFIWYSKYFLVTYPIESRTAFQTNFPLMINEALDKSKYFSKVVVDVQNDSALMAFLFTTNFPPRLFQSMHPLEISEIANGIEANQFSNIYLAKPGERNWSELLRSIHEKTYILKQDSLGNILRYSN